jgi:hypothetical protein
MAQVEEITTLNIDGEAYEVAELSEEIKAMVKLYNDWNSKEYDINNTLIMTRMAKEALSRQIIAKFKEDHQTKEEVPAE